MTKHKEEFVVSPLQNKATLAQAQALMPIKAASGPFAKPYAHSPASPQVSCSHANPANHMSRSKTYED